MLAAMIKFMFRSSVLVFISLTSSNLVAAAASEISIAVLHERDDAPTIVHWNPIADYLTKKIPETLFRIVSLPRNQFLMALDQRRIDFLITSGSLYVELEATQGVSRIASMEYTFDGRRYSNYGGVIFTRHDNLDIQSLADVRGKALAASQSDSFGDYIAASAELYAMNLHPIRDFAVQFTGHPVAKTAFAVRDRKVDVGTIRAETFELLARDGIIRKQDYRILNPQKSDDYPTLHSTRLYPSWPIAKARHTPLELAERVATTLLSMPSDDQTAQLSGISGWTIPLDYLPIQKTLRDLRLAPYESSRVNNKAVDLVNYLTWAIAITILVTILVGSSVFLILSNTRLQKAEGKLRDHRAKLSDLIQKTSMDLVNARNLATSANTAKTRFLANVTHDLQPPLNSIIGLGELLKEKLSRCGLPTERADVDQIIEASKQLLNLVSDILDISRIEEGKVELHPITLHVVHVVTDVLKSVQPIADKHHNILKTVIDDGVGTIRNDVIHFKQLLFNVLKYACECTENGLVTLTVQRIQSPLDDEIVLAVRDSNTEIHPFDHSQTLEHFHHFFHSSESELTRRGLGLSISRAYCELMGGQIRLESTPGIGTEVWIKIPADVNSTSQVTSDKRTDKNQILVQSNMTNIPV